MCEMTESISRVSQENNRRSDSCLLTFHLVFLPDERRHVVALGSCFLEICNHKSQGIHMDSPWLHALNIYILCISQINLLTF